MSVVQTVLQKIEAFFTASHEAGYGSELPASITTPLKHLADEVDALKSGLPAIDLSAIEAKIMAKVDTELAGAKQVYDQAVANLNAMVVQLKVAAPQPVEPVVPVASADPAQAAPVAAEVQPAASA